MFFLLSWKHLFRQFLPEPILLHIKQVALMFLLILSVESSFSVVMEKVIIYGNEGV